MKVSRLMRIRYANVELGRGLRPGKFRDLDANETQQLFQMVGIDRPTLSSAPRRRRTNHRGPRRKTVKSR